MAHTGKLTALKIAKAKGPCVLHDGGGLYLRVAPNRKGREGNERPGAKSWIYRFQIQGKRRDMGLGPYPDISLADARQRAAGRRRLKLDGIDPIEVKRAQQQAQLVAAASTKTFRQIAEELHQSKEAGWRNDHHRVQWKRSLELFAYPTIGDLPVSEIDTGLVMQVLGPIWRTKPETASRVRGRIEAVLDAAKVQGCREGDNPARWRGHLNALLPKRNDLRPVKHHAALPYDQLPTFMVRLGQEESTGARALEFAILTATRSNEIRTAKPEEINLAERVWIIPAERTKNRKEHRVPLSDAAIAVLDRLPPARPGGYLFPGRLRGKPLTRTTMLKVLDRLGLADETVHGMRSSFRDWAEEQTGFPGIVAELALGHTVGDGTERAYRRTDLFDRRRKLMEAWAAFLYPGPADDIVRHLRVTSG